MKNISTYITKLDTFDNQLVQHCNIHEAFNSFHHIYYTFESVGLFPGCKQIIQFLSNHIDDIRNCTNTLTYTSNDIGIDTFFNVLNLYFDTNNSDVIEGAYLIGQQDDDENVKYDEARWNVSENKFNFIDINLYNVETSTDTEILEILTHELTHAWDDYILHKNSSSARNKYIGNKVKQEFQKISDTIKFEKWLHLSDIKKYDKYLNEDLPYIEQILYYIDTAEKNAYIAQINQTLKGKHFKDTKELVKFLNQNSVVYYNYKTIYEIFSSGEYDDTLKELGFKQSTIHKFRKKSKQIWHKLVNHIYHIVYDEHIDECMRRENVNLKITDLQKELWNR